jgi:predicted nucleic acid-binding protein
MAKRRNTNVFSMAFLDIMSCGFGAVILVFIVINHSTEATSQEINAELMAEAQLLQTQVIDETAHLVALKTTIEEVQDQTVTTAEVTQEIINTIEVLTAAIASEAESGASSSDSIEKLKSELKLLEDENANLAGTVDGSELAGTSLRSFVGDGNRQYLTGLNVGGEHILVLIDASASMLHKTIVNAIRLNLLPDEQKRRATKWQRAVRTVDWITANLPKDVDFSLMAFNTAVMPLGSNPSPWVSTSDRAAMDATLQNLYEVAPNGGTSLFNVFSAVRQLETPPDNIFLIVDGLPTQGDGPSSSTVVSSKERVRLFSRALAQLPGNIPINVILFPMEGDPMATPSFWILAQQTGGSFMSPSKDWP